MHLVIIGASGLVGSSLIKEAIKNIAIDKITLISRRPTLFVHNKINDLCLTEFNQLNIENLDLSGDVFVCALGTTIKAAKTKEKFREVDLDYVVAFSRLAAKQKAKSLFIISAAGANKNSRIFYNRVKGEMQEAVRSLDLSSVYFLQPALLIGKRIEKRPLEQTGIFLVKTLSKILPYNTQKKIATQVSDICRFILNIAINPKLGFHDISPNEF